MREVGGEPGQVRRRRTAPSVDRLDRIADRGERETVIHTATEQRRQRDALGVAGVLVLVEQHHPITLPQFGSHLWGGGRQPGRGGHLRTEVHDPLCAHPPMQLVDELDEIGAFGLGGQQLQQPLSGSATLVRASGQVVDQPFEFDVRIAQCRGVDQVLGQRAGQSQHQSGDRRRRLLGVEHPRMLTHHAKRQLPQLRFSDQPGVRLDREQQSVLA